MRAKQFINESMQDSINNAFQNSLQYVSGPLLPKPNGNYRLQDVMKRVKEIKDAIERAKAKGKLDVNSPEYKSAVAELQKWDQWLKDSQNIDKWHPERLKEAVDESWIQAYKALEANGGEPTPGKPTLFVKQMAMLAKDHDLSSLRHPVSAGEALPDATRMLWQEATGSATRIARMTVLADPPSIDLGEVTDKGSINQRAVLARRAALVERLYAPAPDADIILAVE